MPVSRPFRSGDRFALLRLALAGGAAAGLLTLAACSGAAGSADEAGRDAGSSAPAASAPASSAPASSAPASSAPADDSGSDDSGGKPTKEELVAGLVKYYGSTGVTGAVADKTAACLADEIYDTMSADALKSLAEGKLDAAAFSGDDGQAFATASGACVKKMTGGS